MYCLDESRFGLLTLAHKALTARAVKPLCTYQHRFETTYLYGAFSPITGSHLLLELPTCNSETFQFFLNQLANVDPQEFKIVLLDNAAFHKAKTLILPANVYLLFLPPYSPELNPAEKVWWMLKRELKNRFFKTLEDLQQALTAAITKCCTQSAIQQLTAFSYYQIPL
ncbi:MAG: IS630 family transposase [Bacteroidota bacterium]|nr:IS630 family transposase [Bacteroidota bacterium]